MALTQLLTSKGNYLNEVYLDVVISESASSTVKVTNNPVENGADINDHIIIEPMKFSLTGIVSNAITNTLASFGNLAGDLTRSQSAWQDLLALEKAGEPFTLVQGLASYDNVVITNLSESQDKDTSGGLHFTASLTELILVGTGEPPATTFADDDTSDSMVPSTNGGLKTP